MSSEISVDAQRPCWFVGAAFGGKDDQFERFMEEGIWEINNDKYLDTVRSVQPGDSIVIKSRYTRKNNVPFDNKGQTVAVMAVKAVGKVLENSGDGHLLKVAWQRLAEPREWYGYIYWGAITPAYPGKKETDNLIDFALREVPQDFEFFLSTPYWQNRFSDADPEKRYGWTNFFMAFADKLLPFKNNREALLGIVYRVAANAPAVAGLTDTYRDGSQGPLRDICPFTTLGVFNRNQTFENRRLIAAEFAKELGIDEPVPGHFDGIPVLFAQRTWFFHYERFRKPGDIDGLWDIFESALRLADYTDDENREDFARKYNIAAGQGMVGWNLTMGLYWCRPWFYPTLDSKSRPYIEGKLNIRVPHTNPKGYCSAGEYLSLRDTLEKQFQEPGFPVGSFPELSLSAWNTDMPSLPQVAGDSDEQAGSIIVEEEHEEALPPPTYGVEDILAEGCFLDARRLESMIKLLERKKNLILQGPPGTGKTWLGKKLAYALVGRLDPRQVRTVQFHAAMSYEDFVRGWRPKGGGGLELVDGPFREWASRAHGQPGKDFVLIIEEINRGNPAQIFGELLTLLEADKRKIEDGILLNYHQEGETEFYIPSNLYIIGTMNVADRSLALVDYALRRRFAFADLEPLFNDAWKKWVSMNFSVSRAQLDAIAAKMEVLNKSIEKDADLGKPCRIGHSFVTPASGSVIDNGEEWFASVVRTEIEPLLREYWFDEQERVDGLVADLLA